MAALTVRVITLPASVALFGSVLLTVVVVVIGYILIYPKSNFTLSSHQ